MREDSTARIKEYKVKTLGSKKTVEALDEAIPNDEAIHYIAPATVNFFIPDQTTKLQSVGAIAVGDSNFYVMNMLNLAEPQVYPLADLLYIDYKASGLMASQFTMIFKGELTMTFDGCTNRECAKRMCQAIKALAPAVP